MRTFTGMRFINSADGCSVEQQSCVCDLLGASSLSERRSDLEYPQFRMRGIVPVLIKQAMHPLAYSASFLKGSGWLVTMFCFSMLIYANLPPIEALPPAAISVVKSSPPFAPAQIAAVC